MHFDYADAIKGFAAAPSEQTLNALRNNRPVRAIEPDQLVQVTGIQLPAPWGLNRVKAKWI